MPNLSALAPITTSLTALSGLILSLATIDGGLSTSQS